MGRYSNAGSKFDKDLDIVEIAKRLRKQIRQMVKSGLFAGMKCSVRIQRYSLGQSLDVTITKWDGQLHSDEWIAADPNYRYECDRFNPRVLKALEVLRSMAAQWNYNNSDSQTDYFDVNYYSNVSVHWELASKEREQLEAAA